MSAAGDIARLDVLCPIDTISFMVYNGFMEVETMANWFDSIAPGAGAILGGIGGISSGFADFQANQQNIALMREAWKREDNAVSRRVADLKRSGLNPMLAAGSAAQASAPVRVGPVDPVGKSVSSGSAVAESVLSLLRGVVDVQKAQAETQLVGLQAGKVGAETEGVQLSNDLARSLNPLKKTAMQLDVDFAVAANPSRISLLKTQLESSNIGLVNSRLDSELKRLGVSQSQLDLVARRQANQIQLEDMNNKQKEALIKALTIDTLTMSNQQLREATKMGAGVAKGTQSWLGVLGTILGLTK